MRIIIFGTGSSAERLLSEMDSDSVELICFADNNASKYSELFFGRKIIPPAEITALDFDFIIVASQFSVEIMKQLEDIGVPASKIIPYDYQLHNQFMNDEYAAIIKQVKAVRKKDKLRIAVTNYNNSNYHGYALMKYLPEHLADKYDVKLIVEQDRSELGKYDVIVSSHHDGIYSDEYINIELWHGFPLKQMGLMRKTMAETLSRQEKRTSHTHLIMSYSPFYSTLYNACFPSDGHKYRVTGMPRNDLLFEQGSLSKLEKIANQKLTDRNIVFFMPTWRTGIHKRLDGHKEWEKLFDFPRTTKEELFSFVERNNLHIVVKLHPLELHEFKDKDIFEHERLTLLSDDRLLEANVHLYELLPAAKVMITDYSSIFFDTLLLDMPVIFAPTDLNQYREQRGFLLDPIDMLTPGPKVFNLADLETQLQRYLSQEDSYKEARDQVRKLVFHHQDNRSSHRVWLEIDQYLSSR